MADKTPDTAVLGCINLTIIPPTLDSCTKLAPERSDSRTMSWWRMACTNATAAPAASEICICLRLVGNIVAAVRCSSRVRSRAPLQREGVFTNAFQLQ